MRHKNKPGSGYLQAARVALLGLVIASGISACQRLDQKRISEQALHELRGQFLFEEAVELAEKYGDRAKAKNYFAARKDKFAFTGSEQQDVMAVDGYHLRGPSHVIGVSLFFHGEQETLVMVNITVHPSAEERALGLIKRSLDSVDAPGRGPSREAILYFLGLYPLGPSKVIKIMVRKDVLPGGAVYSINYAISAA